jgi:hypothetical protein
LVLFGPGEKKWQEKSEKCPSLQLGDQQLLC